MLIFGTVTGMVVIGEYVQLVSYDQFDAVRLGLTALPNAAADAAFGLPISDAGGLDIDPTDARGTPILEDHNPTIPGTLPPTSHGPVPTLSAVTPLSADARPR